MELPNEIDKKNEELAAERKSQLLKITFSVLLVIAIGCILYATITLVKNTDAIKNPLGENLKNYNLDYCNCFDKLGKEYFISSPDYKKIVQPNILNFSFGG